jgi:hypothetical protein
MGRPAAYNLGEGVRWKYGWLLKAISWRSWRLVN